MYNNCTVCSEPYIDIVFCFTHITCSSLFSRFTPQLACDHALSLCLCKLLSGGGHDTFLLQITCKKASIWTFFWLVRKQYGWFALFRLAKTPPSVSCCWFQSAFWLAQWAVNTHASSLWNFCRLSFLASFKNVWIEISSNEIFSISSYTKNCSQKFTDHLNAIWYRLQVTEATNGFTFQIINSWMESWPGLTEFPPSEACELFWAIFAFTTPFSS